MANKTWNKTKSVMAAGWCNVCKKEMLSDSGGWIVNAEKKRFCHNGIDELCFDKYINNRKNNAGLSY